MLTRTRMLLFVPLAALLLGCPERDPLSFPPLDLGEVELGGEVTDTTEEDEDDSCEDHSDCLDDQLCVEETCIDRDDALDDCEVDDDCPDGFLCIEEDHCEEE